LRQYPGAEAQKFIYTGKHKAALNFMAGFVVCSSNIKGVTLTIYKQFFLK
jgi:hypothetical protein